MDLIEPTFDISEYLRKPLEIQCGILDIPLVELSIDYKGKPERAVLNHYHSLGYYGKHCEGSYLILIIHALCLDKLHKFNTFKSRKDACTRYLKAQFTILQPMINEIICDIQKVNELSFKNNVEEILCEKLPPETYPDVNVEFAQEILSLLGRETTYKIAAMIAINPYGLCRGWPDLILTKDDNLKLVEVKHNDLLTDNQLYTFYNIKKFFDDISVVKITGKKM